MVWQIDSYIPTHYHKEITFSYHKDWWNAFKDRFFPLWLLQRFPVEYEVKTIRACEFHPEIEWRDNCNRMYVEVVKND